MTDEPETLDAALARVLDELRSRQRAFEPSGIADAYHNAAGLVESVMHRYGLDQP